MVRYHNARNQGDNATPSPPTSIPASDTGTLSPPRFASSSDFGDSPFQNVMPAGELHTPRYDGLTGYSPNPLHASIARLPYVNNGRNGYSANSPRPAPATSEPIEHEQKSNGPVCEICGEAKDLSEFVELQCGHNDCVGCFRQYINSRPNERSIKCMHCQEKITHAELKKYMTPEAFEKRDEHIAANAFNSSCRAGEKLTYCPEQCGWCCIRNICPGVPLPTPCGKCDKEFCHKCGAKWTTVRGGSHSNIECAKYARACKTARQAEEERLSLAKVAETTKPCPKCKKPIEKNNGCNHMTCETSSGGCGYQFCWTCLGGYRTAEWRAKPDDWKLQEENFLYPCSSCACFNVPGGTPGQEVEVVVGYRAFRNDGWGPELDDGDNGDGW